MDSKFRNAPLGGFNRQDVTEYLAQSARQHREELESLQARLDEEADRADALEEELQQARKRAGELEQAQAELTARAEAAEAELARLRAEREDVQARCDRATQVEADAAAYALLKQTAADVEMDARCRAREIIDRAQAQAERTKVLAGNWMEALRRRYGESRTQVDATVSHAADELGRALQTLRQFQIHMEEQGGALDGLDQEDEP